MEWGPVEHVLLVPVRLPSWVLSKHLHLCCCCVLAKRALLCRSDPDEHCPRSNFRLWAAVASYLAPGDWASCLQSASLGEKAFLTCTVKAPIASRDEKGSSFKNSANLMVHEGTVGLELRCGGVAHPEACCGSHPRLAGAPDGAVPAACDLLEALEVHVACESQAAEPWAVPSMAQDSAQAD